MNKPEYSVVGSSRYQEFRQRLIELANALNLPLAQAAELVGRPREDALEATRTKLEQDRFSLVLIGAFQSGKSTLFNYLCDGRELSPVGPAGGGIRTSGCRVSAHCVEEGAQEYAIVSWRNKEQLLRSLGSHLRIHYDVAGTKANNVNYLTDDIVNLDDEQSRMQLASYAWKALYEEKISLDTPIELLRFTLIVCHFYPEFRERINQGSPQTEIDSAVLLSSYPQDWEHRWDSMSPEDDTIKQSEDIRRMFRAEDVSFAFCAGVDFYLDCANLRSIGCSVYDCPGLFISDWDTEIAKDCIRKADAILYQFSGDKAPSQSDWDAIQETLRVCLNFGGKDKMIFGVNLKVPQNAWERIEKNSVQPKFHQFGFDSPHLHVIHAGIALRGYEAMLQDYGMLSTASRRAIAVDLKEWEKEDTDTNVVWYLRKKQLQKFIRNLTDDDQELEDFLTKTEKIDIEKLAQLHGVNKLISETKTFAERRKYSSMLIHQGSQALGKEIEQVNSHLTTYLNNLTGTIEEKREQLEAAKRALQDLRIKKDKALDHLKNSITVHEGKVVQYFINILDGYYERDAIPRIKSLFLDCTPGFGGAGLIVKGEKKRAQEFSDGFVKICQDCFAPFREDVKSDFFGQKDFNAIRHSFEDTRAEMMQDFEKLQVLARIPDNPLDLSDEWLSKVANNMLPSEGSIIAGLTEGIDFWTLLCSFITFGIFDVFVDKARFAQEFIDKHDEKFRKTYARSVWEAFFAEGAPMNAIWGKYDEFSSSCGAALAECEKQIELAQKALDEANSPHVQEKIQALQAALAEMQGKKQETEALEQEIRDAANL